MSYAFVHQGTAFLPGGGTLAPEDAEAYNAALEAAELAEWASGPDRAFVYVHLDPRTPDAPNVVALYGPRTDGYRRGDVRTWMGTVLGRCVLGSKAHGPHGSYWYPITVTGTNGRTYYGRYYASSGDYARLKAHKAKGD